MTLNPIFYLANPGAVLIDSNSLDKTLKYILNTLPRTLAPLEAINYSVKKNFLKYEKKIYIFKIFKTYFV